MEEEPQILKDIKETMKQISDAPAPVPVTFIHHPNCKAMKTSNLWDCNCGGILFYA